MDPMDLNENEFQSADILVKLPAHISPTQSQVSMSISALNYADARNTGSVLSVAEQSGAGCVTALR